jgi:asparagine synthase (glutamine-hydrolysing)
MCGIAGFIDFTKNSNKDILSKMTDALIHRGPDDAGYQLYEAPKACIGFGQRRLSILDLSPLGHQPMHFQHLAINFNGEIYNFKEIRKELEEKGYEFESWSDTEVIIKGYHCWGIDVVEKFTGMFAIAIYDKEKNEVIFIRDRAGVKPLYYSWENDLFLFASELKSFYQHPSFRKAIDRNSLALYLKYSYIPKEYTIFGNTFKLLPGHYLKLNLTEKTFTIQKYWDVFDYYNKPKLAITEQEAIDQTDTLLKKAYEYRMVADVPVGVFLSGGYDSTSVAALLQQNRTEKLKTFTIGFHETDFNEAPEAKKIADYLGTDHTEWYLTAKEAADVLSQLPEIYDEPFADNSTVPTVLVSKLARKSVKVALSADGGDEIFGGYNKFNQAQKYTSGIPKGLQSVLSKSMALFNPTKIPHYKNSYNFSTRYEKMKLIWQSHDPVDAVKYISQYITDSEVRSFLKYPFQEYQEVFDQKKDLLNKDEVINNLLAIDYKTFLVDNNLVKVDRATMSVGLEGREPMLDHTLIEFLAQVPSEFKIKNKTNKWLLKEIVHKYVPKELMERPKKPFIAPLMIWFKEELKDQLNHYLSEEALKKTNVFNTVPIIALKDAYLAGEKVNYQKIWQILVFQLWYNKWIEEI